MRVYLKNTEVISIKCLQSLGLKEKGKGEKKVAKLKKKIQAHELKKAGRTIRPPGNPEKSRRKNRRNHNHYVPGRKKKRHISFSVCDYKGWGMRRKNKRGKEIKARLLRWGGEGGDGGGVEGGVGGGRG